MREDLARPPLIAWQRDLDDAIALQRATGKPLLICVNMDGEPASESLAGVHYRDPEFAALTAGFIPSPRQIRRIGGVSSTHPVMIR